MRRVAVMLCTYVTLVGWVAVVTYRSGGAAARGTGIGIYQHRPTTVVPARRPNRRPGVVWVGDSTLMRVGKHPSYVPMVDALLDVRPKVPMVTVAGPGMDFYAYWSLAGRVAAMRPRLVVLIANLRNFVPEGSTPGMTDLTGEIDLADLPRTLTLPYYIRGMTAPRLLLARSLRTALGEDVFLTFEGVRRNAQDAPEWDVLGPAIRPETPGDRLGRFAAFWDRFHGNFDRPIDRGNALVEFMGATVSRLAREGITVLVVVAPFPWEVLAPKHYEEGRFRARIAMLRAVAEENGGHLIDLHHALHRNAFRDMDCHLTATGAAEMARAVAPEVGRLLGVDVPPTVTH